MTFLAIKKLIQGGGLIGLSLFLSCEYLLSTGSPIVLQSLESKTVKDKAIFNRIKLIRKNDYDLWIMQQSHSGYYKKYKKWDKLAIKVNKKIKSVSFYQLPPGPIDELDLTKSIKKRASCFMCHPNGPRVIRPNNKGTEVKMDLVKKLQLAALNLKIMSYPKLKQVEKEYFSKNEYSKLESGELVPFRYPGKYMNEPLKLKACTRCHNDHSVFSRGQLFRQNADTIEFMVNNNYMPPFPYRISMEEKLELKKFISGL